MIVLDASALIDALRLARLVRSAQLDPGPAREALDEAMALPQRLVRATPVHLRRAFALRERIRVVDGLYVVLADELDWALVTTDRRLATADAPCEVRIPPTQPRSTSDSPVPPPRTQ